jgi:pantothenate kinase-related protein Tda10
VQVVSVQEISITYFPRNGVEVSIDDVYQYYADRLELAINDGFNSLAEFEHYFLHSMGKECVFIGQLIHWTDLKY